MAVIYKLTSPEGKIYIGCSNQKNIERRWQRGLNYQNNKRLTDDIEKFGWDAFEHEIIEHVAEDADPRERERYWICHYQSANPVNGYNIHTNYRTEYKKRKRTMVKCVETGKIYKTQGQVARELMISRQYISYLIINNKPYRGNHYQKIKLTDAEYAELT